MNDDGVHTPGEAFEEHFRGSREEIVRRLSVYLPLLEEAGVRSIPGPLLDLGCGRGEWLGLVAAHGHVAVGSDIDERVVMRARGAGFDVAKSDALEDLRSRPEGSLAAVTAFHVVEHIDPAGLGELLAQIDRVLAPGGVVVLETPNPENVTVGVMNFYIDSDHVRPIPPPLLEFHAREAGFPLPWIARVNRAVMGAPLSPLPDDVQGAIEMNAAIYAVNGLLFAAPDYALVAQKPGGVRPSLDAADFARILGPQPLDLESYRSVAAEQKAQRSTAEKLEAEARAAESAQRASHEAARAEEAAERLRVVEERASAAEQRVQQACEDFCKVSNSLSWRVTAPLRAGGALARRFSATQAARPGGSPKRYAKLAVGYPMRWALSQPRLGPTLDKGLTRMPGVDKKVRIAIYETRVGPTAPTTATESPDEADLAGLSESARAVVADLEWVVSREAR